MTFPISIEATPEAVVEIIRRGMEDENLRATSLCILLLLVSDKRAWTISQLGERIGIEPRSVRAKIAMLKKRKLIGVKDGRPVRFYSVTSTAKLVFRLLNGYDPI